jgi:heterogeneous nuclear ribonucleoprotein G
MQIMMERDTGRPRGFGFITYADRRGMENAIREMHGQEFGDRVISVNKAQHKRGEDLDHGSRGGDYSSGGKGRNGGGDWSGGHDDCFKCGHSGHWARDCPLVDGEDLDYFCKGGGYSFGGSRSYGGGERSVGKDDCFKCGRPGHWARDCPLADGEDLDYSYRGGGYSSGGRGSYGGGDRFAGKDDCFKCGRPGHWARDCPLAVGDRGGGGSLFSSRSRFGGGGVHGDRYKDDHYDGGCYGDKDHFGSREDKYGSRDHRHVGDRYLTFKIIVKIVTK